MAAACNSVAESGVVMRCHAALTARWRKGRAAAGREWAGKPQVQIASGRPSTMSGAPITIKSSCCTMCALYRPALSKANGETSAIAMAAQPSAKQTASRFTCVGFVAVLCRAYNPRTYSASAMTSMTASHGSAPNPHVGASACANAGRAVKMFTTVSDAPHRAAIVISSTMPDYQFAGIPTSAMSLPHFVYSDLM